MFKWSGWIVASILYLIGLSFFWGATANAGLALAWPALAFLVKLMEWGVISGPL